MILDALLAFDTNVSLAIAAGTQVSTNVIDLGITSGIPTSANGGGARDIGIGDDPAMKLLVQVITTFTSGGAGTLAVSLQGAIDNGSGAPSTYTTMYTGATVTDANMTAGTRLADIDIPRPVAGQALPRFLRLEYVNSGTHTAGAVECGIVIDRNDQIVGDTGKISGYPAGINVAN